jgi:aspartate/methionine/tyrosine aminotransferase
MIFSVRRGAELVNYELFDTEGKFNISAFEKCINREAEKRDKVIVILNFPNNPTGYTATIEEADAIVGIMAATAKNGTNVIAVTDDAYFGLFFEDDCLKESIFARIIGCDPRLLAVKLDGATKEDFVWGLRVGFVTYGATLHNNHEKVYDALERKTAGAVRGSISNVSHIGQELVLKSMLSKDYDAEKGEKFRIMEARAKEVKRVLSDPKYHEAWDIYPFNSGYFMCLKLKTVDAEALRVHLLNEYGVGLIALGETDLRVAFSCIEKDDIQDLFDMVLKGVNDLT